LHDTKGKPGVRGQSGEEQIGADMKRLMMMLFVFVLFSTSAATAQDIMYGALGGAGFAYFDGVDSNGNVATESALGINLGVTSSYEYNDKIIIRGTIAYSTYFPSTDEFTGGAKVEYSIGDISIEADANYFINDNIYGIGGLGIHMASFSTTWSGWGPFLDGTYDSNDTKFGLHLGGGYKLNDKMAVEAKYILISDIPQIKISFVYWIGEFSF
jgi:opacity protein-like surface antigen